MTNERLRSIDVIRGAVMVLMAIDHVRVFSGLPAGGPTAGIFFTRWITHFCAPAFVFLAGTSAFLYGQRHGGLPRFLLTRGMWLVLLELTIIRAMWTFNLEFSHMMAGVIWVIGWSLIVLAGLVRLPLAVIASLSLVMIAGHNLLDSRFWELTDALGDDTWSSLWKIFYVGFYAGPVTLGGDGAQLMVLYSIVPWAGVMAGGYAFGAVIALDPARRKRLCLGLGLGAIAVFVVLRGFNVYGDLFPWGLPADEGRPVMPPLLSFLNTTKYPASLLFLLMTLGPTIALVPILDRADGPLARWLAVFGRVPFFYYLLHIPLIHVLAVVVSVVTLGSVSPWLFANHPMGNPPAPEGYAWSLGLLYLVWGLAVVLLYFPCRWFAEVKARRRYPWLSYL